MSDPTTPGSEPTPGTELQKKASADLSVPATETTKEAPKNNKRLMAIIIAALVVVGLGAVAAIAFAVLAPQGAPTDPAAQPSSESTDAGSAAPVDPEPEPVDPATANACTTTDVTATFGAITASPGSSSVPIVFTNTSDDNCTLEGFPGVSFIRGTNGTQIGAAASLSQSIEVAPVDIAPDASATATLLIMTTPVADCGSVTADGVRVTLPRSEESFIIETTDFKACENIDVELLSVTAVFAG
ncbi:hypothetical protein M2152_002176 [Microbacteriaceae bacterium SG_E_30_P1]|uniref:DUF4232 domain-containing protein n=1 Tax=Antiquaquibacter oligotrophicus TaxID=2880260 RepID=A0ABT6KPT1_9MICO|nr:DUF4232 domain-containing protein [Antiquaquibacter oligotrophicus]MDH6181994.1 hypothetical protein [Antiquaquibacter oligotrophicus]UDF12337.1 DUF4232 domain-containing protein [Antiquaquibacter oligotrophicus]